MLPLLPLFVLILLLTVQQSIAQEPQAVPNTYTLEDMLELCEIRNDFDKESSVICDPAGVIEFYSRNEIENMFDKLEVTRFNVIVVPAIADMGYALYQSKINTITHRFALDLFNGLNIVKDSRKYDRALIFVSRDQKSVAVICDADMLPKISSSGLESVVDKATEYVVSGDISMAIESTIRRLNLIVSMEGNVGSVENMETHMTKARRLRAWRFAPKMFMGLLVMFIVFAIYEKNVEKHLVKGKVTLGHVLDELNRSVQPSSLQQRRASCPTCLDRFTELDGRCGQNEDEDLTLDYTEVLQDTTEERMAESHDVDDVITNSRKADVNEHRGCLLVCGHEFCETCLQQHLLPKNNMLCPVCLKSIELPSEYQNGSPSTLSDPSNTDDNEDSALLSTIHAGTDVNEILYRLQRIRSLYPRVMSKAMLAKCELAAKENDLALIRDTVQTRFEEVSADLTSRENLLKESVLGDRFALSNARASR
jgi:hypothetical protein